MMSAKPRKRSRKPEDTKKSHDLSSGKSSTKSGTRSDQHRKHKRRKTKKSLPSRLSPLELLPAEILQLIFELWPSPSLPRSSPILGQKLSYRPYLLRSCRALWNLSLESALQEERDEVHERQHWKNSSSEIVDMLAMRTTFLNCPWFDLDFALELELLLFKDFEKLYPLDQRWGDGSLERMPSCRNSQQWENCEMPRRLLQGPWNTREHSLFILLCARINLPINLNPPVNFDAATRGVWNCIKSSNWLILLHLLQRPREFATLGSPRFREQDIRIPTSKLVDLRRRPIYGIDNGLDVDNITMLAVNQQMLYSAIMDHGCDRGVVSLLLIHGLYDRTKVDYLDPVLWDWAERHTREKRPVDVDSWPDTYEAAWTDGIWLKMMLRAINKFAEHISWMKRQQGIGTGLSRDSAYPELQARQGRLLMESFRKDIDSFSSCRGNAQKTGWCWRSDGSGDPFRIPEALRNFTDFEESRTYLWGRGRLSGPKIQGHVPSSGHFKGSGHYGVRCDAWINQVFNEGEVEQWLVKPYVGDSYLQTDQHEIALLKLDEVLENTRRHSDGY